MRIQCIFVVKKIKVDGSLTINKISNAILRWLWCENFFFKSRSYHHQHMCSQSAFWSTDKKKVECQNCFSFVAELIFHLVLNFIRFNLHFRTCENIPRTKTYLCTTSLWNFSVSKLFINIRWIVTFLLIGYLYSVTF